MNGWIKRSASKVKQLVCLGGTLASVLLTTGAMVSAEEIYRPTAAIPMPNGLALTNFDIVWADSVLGMVFFTERSSKSVVAIDTTSNKVVALLGQGRFVGITTDATVFDSGPNGVTVVDHKEVWAGDGDSSVKVIDIASGAVVANIKTGPSRFRADELCHSPVDNVVLIANDRAVDNFISFISTKTYSVLKQIKLDGTGGAPRQTNGIEQCQYDRRTGKFYLAVPEVNGPGNDTANGAVVVINPATMSIEQVWSIPVTACAGPQGMAIGPNNQIALACNGGPKGSNGLPTIAGTGSVIIDNTTGAIVAQFPQIWGCDEMWYNSGDDHYIYPCANNVPPQAFFVDAGSGTGSLSRGNPDSADGFPTLDQSVFTATGLSRAAADPVTNQVYLPVTNAAAPQAAKLCSPFGIPDNLGCILVLTPTGGPTDVAIEGPTSSGSPGSRGRGGVP